MSRLVSVRYRCPECDATHVRPEYIDGEEPEQTREGECYAPHPARGADFEGCGNEVELEAVAWREDRDGEWISLVDDESPLRADGGEPREVPDAVETIKEDQSRALRAPKERTNEGPEAIEGARTAVRYLGESFDGTDRFEIITTKVSGFPLGKDLHGQHTESEVINWAIAQEPTLIDASEEAWRFAEHVGDEPDGSEDELITDGGQILACPECSSAKNIFRRAPGRHNSTIDPNEDVWRCSDCGADFDEPTRRERQQTSGRRGLAGRLADADSETVSADRDETLVTDGGQTVSPQKVVLEAIEEHYARPDSRPTGAPVSDVVDDVLQDESIGLLECCQALAQLSRTGEIYQPSATTVANVSPDGGQVVDLDTADPVAELDGSELLDQHREIVQALYDDDRPGYDVSNEAIERAEALWSEVRSRTETDEPQCPDCGARRWAQAAGEPAICQGCGREARAEMEADVHDAWDEMMQEVKE